MQDLKVLYLQSDLVWENPVLNREHFSRKIHQAFENHHLIVLPETFTTGFPVDPAPFAETEKGETVAWMRALAKDTNAVITGSFLLKEKNSFYNSLIWMKPDGTFDRYDKRHVFSMGGEDKKITKGDKQLITELNGWRIRPMICYDLRFPVWSKNRLDENGNFEYDLAVYVANWPSQRSYPWEMLLIARAIENQAYVLGVNRIGYDGPGNYYSGNSALVDPKGNIVSRAEPGKETAGSVIISKKELTNFRAKFNVGNDWDDFLINV
jgi:predicted amidohydrolase